MWITRQITVQSFHNFTRETLGGAPSPRGEAGGRLLGVFCRLRGVLAGLPERNSRSCQSSVHLDNPAKVVFMSSFSVYVLSRIYLIISIHFSFPEITTSLRNLYGISKLGLSR